jgi:hypothetical protein
MTDLVDNARPYRPGGGFNIEDECVCGEAVQREDGSWTHPSGIHHRRIVSSEAVDANRPPQRSSAGVDGRP